MRVCIHTASSTEGAPDFTPMFNIIDVRRSTYTERLELLTQILASRCDTCATEQRLLLFWTERFPHDPAPVIVARCIPCEAHAIVLAELADR